MTTFYHTPTSVQQAARFKKWGWKETMQSDSASMVPNLSLRVHAFQSACAHTQFSGHNRFLLWIYQLLSNRPT